MKLLLFGTGDYYERYKKWFEHDEIVALLDNSKNKQNTYIDDYKVLSPEEGVKLQYDAIVILSFYVKEMKEQLKFLGVAEAVIYHFFDLHKLLPFGRKKEVQYYGFDKECIKKGKSIVLLIPDLTFGGLAVVTFYMAKKLKQWGYCVAVGSMLDGMLREEIIQYGISVIVDNNLQIRTMAETEWIDLFDIVFCNTIGYYVFLSEIKNNCSILWWLHDSSFFYDGVDVAVLNRIDTSKVRFLSVGPIPTSAMLRVKPDVNIEDFLYGMEDETNGCALVKKEKSICFITVGYIEWRKGQDILIDAIRQLPQNIYDKCKFYLVGHDSSLLAQRIKQETKEMPVIITGVVERTKLNTLLDEADMLICPSREDPMPGVATEAMMHSVPCLVSDATGTASYITDYKNGLTFHSEDVEELANKIQWCVENISAVRSMRKAARATFKEVFSMSAFEKRLLEILE